MERHNIYGYVRVSSTDQNEERQMMEMRRLGVAECNIYVDKQSGRDFNRPQYARMAARLAYCGRSMQGWQQGLDRETFCIF